MNTGSELCRRLPRQGGSHRDARWRRARAASDSEGGSEGSGSRAGDSDSGEDSDGDASERPGGAGAALEDMSDEDVREELRREQQQRLLAMSQVCLLFWCNGGCLGECCVQGVSGQAPAGELTGVVGHKV